MSGRRARTFAPPSSASTCARHRGNGVLQELLAATEAWLRGVGVRQVRLHVNEANTRAIGGYRKCGYVDTGKRVEMSDGLNHEMVHDLYP